MRVLPRGLPTGNILHFVGKRPDTTSLPFSATMYLVRTVTLQWNSVAPFANQGHVFWEKARAQGCGVSSSRKMLATIKHPSARSGFLLVSRLVLVRYIYIYLTIAGTELHHLSLSEPISPLLSKKATALLYRDPDTSSRKAIFSHVLRTCSDAASFRSLAH